MLERERIQTQIEDGEEIKPYPYVVSEDIGLLLPDWANSQGFTLPRPEFIDGLRSDFKNFMSQVFQGFEQVPEVELSDGLRRKVEETGLFPISFDKVYYRTEIGLEITRLVDEEGQDKGLGRRKVDNSTLLLQFKRLRETGIREALLVDDVLFTGDMIRRIVRLLERMGIKVPIVCVGIAITEGITRLNDCVREVRCVRKFDKVIDEICERDFYPGVPMCGRSLIGEENVGVPYILPFGNPGRWASIPIDWQRPFSRFCLEQTIRLFEEIEKVSGKTVQCQNLERKVLFLPRDESRFVDALRQLL